MAHRAISANRISRSPVAGGHGAHGAVGARGKGRPGARGWWRGASGGQVAHRAVGARGEGEAGGAGLAAWGAQPCLRMLRKYAIRVTISLIGEEEIMTPTRKIPAVLRGRPRRRLLRGYARPSTLEGAARLMDLGGALDNYQVSLPSYRGRRRGREAAAIREIWGEVGQYLRGAIGQFESENGLSVAPTGRRTRRPTLRS